ncbi:MAG: NAD(P)-dependent oxidoreductase [Oscillospiraceae bacterium]|nr:NAD(P)-dependent oxidoreductase [Oscillospiraceae bacterium]
MKDIGFIGVGVMGKSMVRNLMKAGYSLSIYTRTKSKVEDVISEGAFWCDSVGECAKDKDAVITIVGYPSDVKEVYLNQGGIIEAAREGCYIIDMTTSDPDIAKHIYAAAAEKNVHALDAPVSGGDVGAKNGTLAIMVGGDQAAFDACLPLFEAMGKNIVYEGEAGNGQHTKMANQIALGGAIAGVCEAMTYAKKVGLDVETMLNTISSGAAGSWQMSNMAPRILNGDFNPGFYLKHYVKDLRIALEQADASELELAVTKLVFDIYESLQDEYGDLGTQALIKNYDF